MREGDAFIVFSKKSVLNIAGRLEENGIKPSVIYGSLPPEIRRRQMTLLMRKDTGCRVNRCDRNGTQSAGQKNCISGGGKV